MTNVATWFCFSGDAECLTESVAAYRLVDPSAAIALSDDGRSPLDAATVRSIDPDHYERSDVNRGGNLRGAECTTMILDFSERMAAKYQADMVVKLDCDTAVFSNEWLVKAPLVGFEYLPLPSALGCCRAMSPEALSAAMDRHLSRWHGLTNKTYEDQVIAYYALRDFGPECVIYPFVPRRLVGWDYRTEVGEKPPFVWTAEVVTFGNRMQLSERGGQRGKRLAASDAMKKYREERNNR